MSISTSAKLAPVKRWSATLVAGSTTLPLLELPSRSMGVDQARGTCSAVVNGFPAVASGTAAHVDITLNGETERFFTGKVDVRPISNNPPKYEISLIDTLGRLDAKLKTKIVWRNTSWISAVRTLLNKAGISDGEIESIYDPGNNFKLGSQYAIEVAKGDNIQSTLKELCDFAGADITVDVTGQVTVINAPGWPASSPTPTIIYAYAGDKDTGEFGYMDARRTLGGSESRVKSFTAKGPRRPDKQIPDATFTLTGADGKHEDQEYKYCQTNGCAGAIAQREIVKRNRTSTEVEVNAPLNPGVRAGMSLYFRDMILGFSANTLSLVLSVTSSGHTMTMRLSVGPRPADGSLTFTPPPTADFTLQFEQQPVTVAGVTQTRVVVQAIDTSHDGSGFGITSRAWLAACDTGVEPTTSDKADPIFIFATLDNATVSLTVESASGEGATKTVAVTPGPSEVFTRCLSVAADDGWYVLAGTAGWRKWSSGCTAVPGINDQGPLVAGFSDGRIVRSDDVLATEPLILTTLSGGAVRCMFVNEGVPTDILAGVGSTLYRSSDGGVTWGSLVVFDAPVQYCESSPLNPDIITVCKANVVVQSSDAGASWTALLTGPDGTTCRKIASAPWGTLAVWSGTTDLSTAYQFVGGGTLDWSAVPGDKMPVDLASVTALIAEEGFILASGAANDLVRDGLFPQLTYLANSAPVTPLYKVVSNVVTYIGASNAGGALKVVNHGGAYPVAPPTAAFHIGYGQPTDAPQPPEFVILPNITNGDGDKLYHYKPGIGFVTRDLPIAGYEWFTITINPINPAQWIIAGGASDQTRYQPTRFFYTANMGITWIEIFRPNHGPEAGPGNITFTGHGSSWIMVMYYFNALGARQTLISKGEASVVQQTVTYGSGIVPPVPAGSLPMLYNLAAGQDDDVAIGYAAFVPDKGNNQTYTQFAISSTLALTTVGDSPYEMQDKRMASGPAMLATWNNNIGVTPNYQTTVPTAVIAAGGSAVEVESGVYAGNRTGIARVDTFDTAPVVVIAAAAGVAVNKIVRGRRRRCVGAIEVGNGSTIVDGGGSQRVFIFTGTEWTVVTTPAGIVFGNTLGLIEL